MTKEPEKVQLTVITQELEDPDDPPALTSDREGSAGAGGGGESSEGEGDIEIEHVGDESSPSGGPAHGLMPTGNITFDVRRRTLINIYQRTILEEFYRCGMTSASLMLNHLHTAAAEKTGLEISVVKNWIRNRRRPTAVRSAEKFVEKISQGNLPPVPTIPNIPSLPTNMTSMGLSTQSTLPSDSLVVTSSAQPSVPTFSNLGRTLASHLLPEPKRLCTDSILSNTLSVQLPPQSQSSQQQQQQVPPQPSHSQPQHHVSVSIPQSSLATAHQLQLTPPPLPHSSAIALALPPQTVITSTSSATSNGSSSSSSSSRQQQQKHHDQSRSLLVKVRISGSGESDFVEVEVPSLSYPSLLKSCCEELELVPHEIAKIRKLPNVWVRKDKDVQRMREGQELEIIVKSIAVPNSTTPPITTMLTVNPFSAIAPSSASNLTLITTGASISGGSHGLGVKGDNDNGLLAALTNQGPVSMPELTNIADGGGNPSNQVNGLH